MQLSFQVFNQVLIMLLLMGVGFTLLKLKILTDTGIGEITSVLLNIVTPCVLIEAYQKEFDITLLTNLLYAVILTFLVHVSVILVSTLLFGGGKSEEAKINIFGSVYSNCGFMGIPLLTALFGETGVFYGAAYLLIFTVLYWTHGIYIYAGGKNGFEIRNILLNPGIIGTLISLVIFFLGIKLPAVISESVHYISQLNTPLAMLVIGTFLARVDYKSIFNKGGLYLLCFIKLIITPLLCIYLGRLLNADSIVLGAAVVLSACPTAAVSALFAAKFGLDAKYASGTVAVTTVLSVVTLPLILTLL